MCHCFYFQPENILSKIFLNLADPQTLGQWCTSSKDLNAPQPFKQAIEQYFVQHSTGNRSTVIYQKHSISITWDVSKNISLSSTMILYVLGWGAPKKTMCSYWKVSSGLGSPRLYTETFSALTPNHRSWGKPPSLHCRQRNKNTNTYI